MKVMEFTYHPTNFWMQSTVERCIFNKPLKILNLETGYLKKMRSSGVKYLKLEMSKKSNLS